MQEIIIRPIQSKDNAALSSVIKRALEEYDMATEGTVYTDETTDRMSTCYTDERTIYYIVEVDGQLVGGCGLAALEGELPVYCELQRMFLAKESRGQGIAQLLLDKTIAFAKANGYQYVYLETAPKLKAAIRLYEKNDFQLIDHSMGNTGHHACQVWMLKSL